jgi:hypothetical protein
MGPAVSCINLLRPDSGMFYISTAAPELLLLTHPFFRLSLAFVHCAEATLVNSPEHKKALSLSLSDTTWLCCINTNPLRASDYRIRAPPSELINNQEIQNVRNTTDHYRPNLWKPIWVS